ncbi:hypothetical protein A1O3_07225 [Capronia epimyces CBS 606.96]|uniref:DUF7924 domain-containing protein n=1 Tax=Capronia epimyces CBS 606.96 TaxID=1182542 RepID=W9XKB0_9EURO|nr:uncharacterized protein A1O3_07225 [Capronia epimyces CBS 606.96]EXJ80937.1 hypothetical protein A1O3_07225 [Capronia epimyces CBS 606.96]
MIDNGVYPEGYEHPDGHTQPEPANLDAVHGRLLAPRASLSPSQFTDDDFRAFKQENARASGETTSLQKVFPFIAGNETNHRFEADTPLNNLEPIDKCLGDPKPDRYYGAAPSAIDTKVLHDLAPYIIPSTNTSRPAAPNFFLEAKSPSGLPFVAKNQALYNGVVGARAMHKLQNYGANEATVVYDNNAYSFSTTYQAGPGLLVIYATHPTQSAVPGRTEYHMTQVKAYALTSDRETFVQGVTSYRNIRDLAKENRDAFIDHANQMARRAPADSPSTAFTNSTSSSALQEEHSETSADELALQQTVVKRPRRAHER